MSNIDPAATVLSALVERGAMPYAHSLSLSTDLELPVLDMLASIPLGAWIRTRAGIPGNNGDPDIYANREAVLDELSTGLTQLLDLLSRPSSDAIAELEGQAATSAVEHVGGKLHDELSWMVERSRVCGLPLDVEQLADYVPTIADAPSVVSELWPN
jgi:hypothetical protein